MTFNQLVKHYGSQAAAARALGIKPPSVAEWKESGIPLPRQAQYEVLTNGVLQAERPSQTAKSE
jgi:DNA-binding transcriptional regulator YdaS (Cro superfamily)